MYKISTRNPGLYRKLRSRNMNPRYIDDAEHPATRPEYSEASSETASSGLPGKVYFPSNPNSGFNIDLADAIRRGTSARRIKALAKKHLSKKLRLSEMASLDALKDAEEGHSRAESRKVYRENHFLTN